MLIVLIRTFILYSVVGIVFRIMGKRQIGELQPFELAITIMISALAAFPMGDIGIPLINTLIQIILLVALEIYISIINTKSSKVRSIICGQPTILIENGKLNRSQMEKSRVNIHELLEELRIKGYPNISNIEFAFIETNGKVSVMPKSQKRPVVPDDLGIDTDYEGIPHPLIIDGKVDKKALTRINLSEEWLKEQLSKFGINETSDVFFASVDSSGNLFYQSYKN